MARRSSQQSVSLFPFLAVLVCTMGALILLLLVTTRRIRQEQAKYTAAVEVLDDLEAGSLTDDMQLEAADFIVKDVGTPQSEANQSVTFQQQWLPKPDANAAEHDKLTSQIELLAMRNAELSNQRTLLDENIQDKQEQLSSVNMKIQESEVEMLTVGTDSRQLKQAQETLKALKADKADLELQIEQQKRLLAGVQAELEEKSAFTEEAEAVLTKRESALISLRRIVAKSSETLGVDGTSTQLEFTNTAGTSRVPIVVNVDEVGFTFLPSNITVTLNDLKGFPANDNPLIAGIQATAEHRSEGLLADEPYVLLLVRPTGSLGFYQAQQVMTNANIHFGYELLETDRTVALGQQDEEEQSVVRQSILEALNRRTNLYGALLAAQQHGKGSRQRFEDQQASQPRPSATNSGSMPNDRPGPDGRTLRELMDLGRVYAGGEPKPQAKIPRLAGDDFRNRQWPSSPNQESVVDRRKVASNPPRIQMTPETEKPEARLAARELNPWEESGDPQPVNDGASAGMSRQRADMDFGQERTQKLSGNLGLNRQPASTEQPNASAVGAQLNEQLASQDAQFNPGSSDVDWPSIEAAPQLEGTRPVDPDLPQETLGTNSPSTSSPQAFALPDEQASVEITPRTAQSSGQNRREHLRESNTPAQHHSPPSQSQRPVAGSDTQATPFLAEAQLSNRPNRGQATDGMQKPVNPKLSYLQQFLDEVEQQRNQARPNPVLLRLLRRAQGSQEGQLSKNLAAPQQRPVPEDQQAETGKSVSHPSPTKPEPSAAVPAATQETPQPGQKQPKKSPVFYVVRVYISDDQLIVGPFEGIDVEGWSDQQVAEAAYMGVSETMKGIWADIRQDALPAVRFLAADGAERRSRVTSEKLKAMNIPTRAFQMEGVDVSVEQFFSDNLPPTTQSQTSPASPEKRPPQQPKPQALNDGRLSI